ncbi:MAG: hypothetical protein ACYDGY_08930 [Acidimicrobiales bacterium]
MAQPGYEPVKAMERIRPSYRLHAPGYWTAHRSADFHQDGDHVDSEVHKLRGFPGPDQGYALNLARVVLLPKIALKDGESEEDVLAGLAAIATARASLLGRAPVGADLHHAASLFSFGEAVPVTGVLEKRRVAFSSAAHDYRVRRNLVDSVAARLV